MEHFSNKLKVIFFLVVSLFLTPVVTFAATYTLNADTGGSVSINGFSGGTVVYTVASGTRAFIQAIPDDGKTFSSWSTGFTTYSSTLNPIATSSVSALALFSNAPSANMSINNQCVERVITFTNTTARAEGQSQVTNLTKTQIYILEGSSDTIAPQDSTGYLFSSPNQSFYYAHNASTVGAGTYLGSNAAFRGRTSYLSIGSANVTSDVRYNCAGASVTRYTVTLTSNIPISSTDQPYLIGAGTYNNNSSVTISTNNVPNFTFLGWSGSCGNTAYLFPNNTVKFQYPYTISNLQSNCSFEAQYKYVPITGTALVSVKLTAEPNGSVSVNGTTGGVVQANYNYGSTINVSAIPNSGYEFSGWSGLFAGQPSSFNYQVTGSIDVLAYFRSATTTAGTGSCGSFAPDLRIFSDKDGAGFMTVGLANTSLLSTGAGISYFTVPGNGYTYNCTSWQVPTPTSNYGFAFIGWTGNLASSTMDTLNQSGYINTSELNGITSPQIIAMFSLNGNPSGGTVSNVLVRPIAQSPTAIFNSDLVDYSTVFTNEDGVFPLTPYRIDGRCVVKVIRFKAREVGIFSSIFQSFAGEDHNYTLYALEGSDLSFNKQNGGIYSGVYTFKSDPSNLYMAVDGAVLPSGNYNGNDTVFSASQQSFDFVNVVPLENPKDYSCTDPAVQSVSSLTNVSIHSFDNPIVGIAYSTITGPNLVTVYGTGTTYIDGSSSSTVITTYDNLLTQEFYQRVSCSVGNGGARVGVYCAMPVSSSSIDYVYNPYREIPPTYFDYKYLWLFTSHPMKGFYHQEVSNWDDVYADGYVDESEKIYGIQYYPADRVVPVRVGSTTINYSTITDNYLSTEFPACAESSPSCVSSNDLNLYATRVDLTKCYFYKDVIDFRDQPIWVSPTSCAQSILANASTTPSPYYGTRFTDVSLAYRSNPKDLNGFLVDGPVDFDKDVLFYRAQLTSNAAINFNEGEDPRKVFTKIRTTTGDVIRYNKTKSSLYRSVGTTTIFVATSTTPSYTETIDGYWDTIFHATSTVNATSTGGTITKIGDDWLHTFTSSGTFTTNAVGGYLRYLVVGAGGEGGSVSTGYQVGGGGAAGEAKASSTYLIATTTYSITVGATTTTNGGPSSFGSVVTAGGGNVGESNNTDSNGGNNSSYTGGTGSGYDAGGGAGSSGNGSNLLTGGNATSNDITGSSVNYAGGGFGGTNNCSSTPTNGGGFGGDGNCATGRSGGHATTPGSGGGGAGMLASGSAPSGDGAKGIVHLRVASTTITIPAYTEDVYVATTTIFHATSTTDSYYTTGTGTVFAIGGVASSTGIFNGLFYFTSDSYNASIGLTNYSSLSAYTNSLFSQFDVNDPIYGCYKVEYSLAQSFGCSLRAVVGALFLSFIIPDNTQIKIMNDGLNNMILNGGVVSTILSMPLRTINYSNLAWKPSTTTPIVLAFDSSRKATLNFTVATSTPFAKSDKLISDFIYPFLLVGLLLLSGFSAIKIFS
jgi:hypothetical protein